MKDIFKKILFSFFILNTVQLLARENILFDGVQGEVEGHALVISIDKNIMSEILRPEYQLLPQDITNAQTHPLLLLFFKFKNIRPSILFPKFSSLVPAYNSVYLLAPYTKLLNSTQNGIYSVMPRGFMSNQLMVMCSRLFNGLPKEYAEINSNIKGFNVTQKEMAVLSVEFNKFDSNIKGASSSQIKSMIDMLTLSDRPIDSGNFGTSKVMIDWKDVTLYPESAKLTLEQNLFNSLGKKYYSTRSYFFKSNFKIGNFTAL